MPLVAWPLRSLLHLQPRSMLILFDHSTPAPLAAFLTGHTVTKAKDRGWDRFGLGDLLAEVERAGFELFLTADNSIRYQQNLSGRTISVVVLSSPQWPLVRLRVDHILAAVNAATPEVLPKSKFHSQTKARGANARNSQRSAAAQFLKNRECPAFRCSGPRIDDGIFRPQGWAGP